MKKLSFGTKLSYGLGDFYGGASASIIGLFFLYFLTNIAGLPPLLAGTIVLVGRVVDAVIDPFMGAISDHTRSRWGRRVAWFLFGIIPVALSYILLWFVPPCAQWLQAAYYFFVYAFFACSFSMVMVPYGALPQDLTSDSNERTVLVSVRMAFSVLGGLLSAVVPDMMIKRAADLKTGYFIMGLSFAILFALIWVILFLSLRSKVEAEAPVTTVSLGASIKYCIGNKSFLLLCAIYLLSFIPNDIMSSNFKYFINDVLFMGDKFALTMGSLMVCAVLSLPLYVLACRRFGKRRTFIYGSIFRIAALLLLYLLGRDSSLFRLVAIAVLIGFGTGVAYAIPWSMLPDVTDLDEAYTGYRQEGIYTGLMTFIRQLSSGVAIFLVGLLLQISGYTAGAAEQASVTKTVIVGILTVVPILFVLLGIFAAIRYPIDRKNEPLIRDVVDQRRSGAFAALDEQTRQNKLAQLKVIVDAKRKGRAHAEEH
ncbi:MAG TPA: MFS transporter [Candidatus Cryosericum sp.]|nr:MFS transporter [Candidatus Cryosericum sp.]